MNKPAKKKEKVHTCSICRGKYVGYGNNAYPINDGRCCNNCNDYVILARMRLLSMFDKKESHQ